MSRRSLGFSSPYTDQLEMELSLEECCIYEQTASLSAAPTPSSQAGAECMFQVFLIIFRKMLSPYFGSSFEECSVCVANFKIAQTFPHVLVLLKSALKTFS